MAWCCVVVAAGLAGCGAGEESVSRVRVAPTVTLEEFQGRVNGIALRDTRAEIKQALGKPVAESLSGPSSPESVPAPAALPGGHRPDLRYEQLTTTMSASDRVASITVWDPGVVTSRGVAIGDTLTDARRAYDLDCVEEDTQDIATSAQCFGKLAPGTYIIFVAFLGGERIGTIALTTEPPLLGCGQFLYDGSPTSVHRRCRREAITTDP